MINFFLSLFDILNIFLKMMWFGVINIPAENSSSRTIRCVRFLNPFYLLTRGSPAGQRITSFLESLGPMFIKFVQSRHCQEKQQRETQTLKTYRKPTETYRKPTEIYRKPTETAGSLAEAKWRWWQQSERARAVFVRDVSLDIAGWLERIAVALVTIA